MKFKNYNIDFIKKLIIIILISIIIILLVTSRCSNMIKLKMFWR